MEAEMTSENGSLQTCIAERRRTSSFSDDYSVQKTNDDASECKYTAVKIGYYSDTYISRFINPKTTLRHRDPEILRGYWARVASIQSLVENFIQAVGLPCQIVNIGAGFDTLYWRLKKEGIRFTRFVEIDFSSVTSRKIKRIRMPGAPDLVEVFSSTPEELHHKDLFAGDYFLVGADLRQWDEVLEKLKSTGLVFNCPTIFIAECVLVYMSVEKSRELLSNISRQFETAVFLNYEQVSISDAFGNIMISNLMHRGIALPGLSDCESLEAQANRFLKNGWCSVSSTTMRDIYNSYLPKDDIARIEKIDLLDEPELLSQLLEHYCIVVAVKAAERYNFLNHLPSSFKHNHLRS